MYFYAVLSILLYLKELCRTAVHCPPKPYTRNETYCVVQVQRNSAKMYFTGTDTTLLEVLHCYGLALSDHLRTRSNDTQAQN